MKTKINEIVDEISKQEKVLMIWQTVCRLVAVTLLLSGCTVVPKQLDGLQQDDGKYFARIVEHEERSEGYKRSLLSLGHQFASPEVMKIPSKTLDLTEQVFVRGDVLRITINGMPELKDLYQITKRGFIDLPYAMSIVAAGLNRQLLLDSLKAELVSQKWFYEDHINIDVSLVRLAPINVAVTGAVFSGGRVSVNDQPALKQEDSIQHRAGVFSSNRDLIAALQAAGGVRPDADLNRVYIKRGEVTTRVPLATLMTGSYFSETPSLINGDEIFVASTNAENARLIKPSQITPPGMRVLMSNLTAPSLNNAQSAVGSDSTRLPYGSSLLDSAVSANCIGGTQSANASRSVVLITRNYGSKKQLVIKRSINQLLASSSDPKVNPYLMPNDGIACYDSRFTNFRDVARGIGELVGPFILGGLL